MSKTVFIVHAHPDPASLNAALTRAAVVHLQELGHRVLLSDLCAMGWKAEFDGRDFLERKDKARLDLIAESGHAYASGTQTADVMAEQEKLSMADAVIFQFPLWWFGLPAILKGWIDRVFAYGLAYGYRDAGNTYRYGEGGLAGKRALLSVTVGGPAIDYSPRGINGPLEDLLFPVTHGSLFFAGMTVLPTHAIFDVGHLAQDDSASFAGWSSRLDRLFSEQPIPFRAQNGGDYPDRHVLAAHVAPDLTGFAAHLASRAAERQPTPAAVVGRRVAEGRSDR